MSRITPSAKYRGLPCSYVGTGCAYEDVFKKPFDIPLPEGLKDDGWLTLENENRYIRQYLPIKKKQYFKRNERITLWEFLETNTERCGVCVYGHFIYVNGKDYWSFFNNEEDPVVCVWYIGERKEKESI